MSHAYIKRVTTVHTGGNCNVDVVELDDGKCLCINGECVVLFPSREAFDDPEFDASNLPTWYTYERVV